MFRRFVIQARIDYAPLQSPNSHLLPQYFFLLLNEICNGGSSKEPFLKTATLSIMFGLIFAKRKQTKGILKMPPFRRVRLLTRDEHAHSFCHWVDRHDTATKRMRMLKPRAPFLCVRERLPQYFHRNNEVSKWRQFKKNSGICFNSRGIRPKQNNQGLVYDISFQQKNVYIFAKIVNFSAWSRALAGKDELYPYNLVTW